VIKHSSAGSQRIAELEGPCVFGEMAMLNHEPRSAAVRAVTKVVAGYLSQDLYEQRIAEENSTALHISLNLGKVACQRLRVTTGKMLHMTEGAAEGAPAAAPAGKTTPELKKLCTRFLKGDAS
jgi:CRP-like cAMP-binding protein